MSISGVCYGMISLYDCSSEHFSCYKEYKMEYKICYMLYEGQVLFSLNMSVMSMSNLEKFVTFIV